MVDKFNLGIYKISYDETNFSEVETVNLNDYNDFEKRRMGIGFFIYRNYSEEQGEGIIPVFCKMQDIRNLTSSDYIEVIDKDGIEFTIYGKDYSPVYDEKTLLSWEYMMFKIQTEKTINNFPQALKDIPEENLIAEKINLAYKSNEHGKKTFLHEEYAKEQIKVVKFKNYLQTVQDDNKEIDSIVLAPIAHNLRIPNEQNQFSFENKIDYLIGKINHNLIPNQNEIEKIKIYDNFNNTLEVDIEHLYLVPKVENDPKIYTILKVVYLLNKANDFRLLKHNYALYKSTISKNN